MFRPANKIKKWTKIDKIFESLNNIPILLYIIIIAHTFFFLDMTMMFLFHVY